MEYEYVLQVLPVVKSEPLWRRNGDPFYGAEELRQTPNLGFSSAFGLYGLRVRGVRGPRGRTQATCDSQLGSSDEFAEGGLVT